MAGNKKKLIRYPEERALEDAAFDRGLTPTRIFGVLLHLKSVDIEATVTEGEPYDLIDRYLERGIAEAGLTTTTELAEFFALDVGLVDSAVRYLSSVGHLQQQDGRLQLTELGTASVRDKVRYTVTLQDRRKLYFDAFGSRPLTRPYYDSRNVTLLSYDEAAGEAPRFLMTYSPRGFRHEALALLASDPKRDLYNFPARIDHPRSLGEEDRYLPMYIVRAVSSDRRARHLAYTQVGDSEDSYVSTLIEQTPELTAVLDNEERSERSGLDQDRANEWLHKRGLTDHRVERATDNTWRVTLPPISFGAGRPLAINKLGSYVVLGNGFFHVWCTDVKTRRRALLERVDAYLGSRARVRRTDADELVRRITRQLDLGSIDLVALRRMAADSGRRELAAQLGRLG